MDRRPSVASGSARVHRQGWGRRTLHAAVLDADATTVRHHWRRLDRPDRPWIAGEVIATGAKGPALLTSSRGQLIALVEAATGPSRYRWESRTGGWVAERSPRPAAVVEADHRLIDDQGSVFHDRLVKGVWVRQSCLRLVDDEPFDIDPAESVRVAQVSGSRDARPGPRGVRAPTLSDSLATAGIMGTDLGVRVDLRGRTFLLCGDSHWRSRPWLATRDSIAEVHDPLADLPQVVFHGSPLKLLGPRLGSRRVTMREYDVPLDAVGHGGQVYGFFTSNHFSRGRVMGRCVIGRLVDPALRIDPGLRRRPIGFEVVATLSSEHFINVQVHRDGDRLLVWGSGAYRASHLRLASLDLAALHQNRVEVRYWAGEGWSGSEVDAAPVVRGAFGEFSVRWVPWLGRYLMLSCSAPGERIGSSVVLRTSTTPWGPWSRRRRLLDWIVTGMSPDPEIRFIRASLDDEVADRIFGVQARMTGAAYAPYLFDAEPEPGGTLRLRYTLSTWNPYQVVLMEHRLDAGVLGGG